MIREVDTAGWVHHNMDQRKLYILKITQNNKRHGVTPITTRCRWFINNVILHSMATRLPLLFNRHKQWYRLTQLVTVRLLYGLHVFHHFSSILHVVPTSLQQTFKPPTRCIATGQVVHHNLGIIICTWLHNNVAPPSANNSPNPSHWAPHSGPLTSTTHIKPLTLSPSHRPPPPHTY